MILALITKIYYHIFNISVIYFIIINSNYNALVVHFLNRFHLIFNAYFV